MTIHRLKLPHEDPDDLDGFNNLFDDVSAAGEHELEIAIAAVKPTRPTYRSVHPVAAAIPSIDDDAYSNLVADIRRNGQRKAVAMYQGMIFDGRARYDACFALGLLPKVRILRTREPSLWLIQRNYDRFGEPESALRKERTKPLRRLYEREWREEAVRLRAEWIAEARKEFQQMMRQWSHPESCRACGLGVDYSHAHHVLPLSIQYEIGINMPLHDHQWLCPVHHRDAHRLIAAEITGWSRSAHMVQANHKLNEIVAGGIDLFRAAGGVTPRGNGGMF